VSDAARNRRPRIGLPLCLDARERWREGRRYLYIDAAYGDAIRAAGGEPRLLPIGVDPAAAIADVDGLLIPGGDDFAPPAGRYATPDLADVFDPVPEEQLAFDRALFEAARAAERPVLGICYGMQLVAVSLGASLHYHLPLDLPDAAPHKLPDGLPGHAVDVVEGSLLASLLPESDRRRLQVNSLHHQAIAEPGPTLRASATSPDGVIEAIEPAAPEAGAPFLLGVQWHPEKPPHSPSPTADPVLAGFVAAARRRGPGETG